MTTDIGTRLLEVLRKQRQYFIYTADRQRIITNRVVYYGLEEELLYLQRLIGRDNKKLIKQECDKLGVPYPNFRREGTEK